jgi:hypothetical protein
VIHSVALALAATLIAVRGPIVSVVLMFGAIGATAVTLNVMEKQLVDASGVDVGGTLYDVAFVDGSCIALFSERNEVIDFTFQISAAALDAAQALLDQMFLDDLLGRFDTHPYLTEVCTEGTDSCLVDYPLPTYG